jgi:WD40 repeat protein
VYGIDTCVIVAGNCDAGRVWFRSSSAQCLVDTKVFSFHSFVFKNYEEMKNHFKTHTGMGEMFAHSVKVQTVDWNYDGRKLPSDSFDKTAFIFTRESDTLVSSL